MFQKMMTKATSKISNLQDEVKKQSIGDTSSIIEKYWPQIETLLIQQLLKVTKDQLQDDKNFEKVFLTAYEVIPTPVKIVLPREKFLAFCMSKKNTLITKLDEKKLIDPSFQSLSTYKTFLPDILSFCIVTDEDIKPSKVRLALDFINHDDIIEDKQQLLESFSNALGQLIIETSSSPLVLKLKIQDISSQLLKLHSNEKEKINILLQTFIESSHNKTQIEGLLSILQKEIE